MTTDSLPYTTYLAQMPQTVPVDPEHHRDMILLYVACGAVILALLLLIQRLRLKKLRHEIDHWHDPTERQKGILQVISISVDDLGAIKKSGHRDPELSALIDRYNDKVSTYEITKVGTIIAGIIAGIIGIFAIVAASDDDGDSDTGFDAGDGIFFGSSDDDSQKKKKHRKPGRR